MILGTGEKNCNLLEFQKLVGTSGLVLSRALVPFLCWLLSPGFILRLIARPLHISDVSCIYNEMQRKKQQSLPMLSFKSKKTTNLSSCFLHLNWVKDLFSSQVLWISKVVLLNIISFRKYSLNAQKHGLRSRKLSLSPHFSTYWAKKVRSLTDLLKFFCVFPHL